MKSVTEIFAEDNPTHAEAMHALRMLVEVSKPAFLLCLKVMKLEPDELARRGADEVKLYCELQDAIVALSAKTFKDGDGDCD